MADSLPVPSPSIPDLIQRYLNGTPITELAADARVSYQTIYNWFMAETGPEYEHIITRALVNRIADADYDLEKSASMFEIARARERARFSRMDFERRRPKLYGPKQELQVDNQVTITINRQPVILPVVTGTVHNDDTSVSVQEVRESQ